MTTYEVEQKGQMIFRVIEYLGEVTQNGVTIIRGCLFTLSSVHLIDVNTGDSVEWNDWVTDVEYIPYREIMQSEIEELRAAGCDYVPELILDHPKTQRL